jgi:acyl carrier protein
VLRSPTYADLISRNSKLRDTEADSIDLLALAASHGIEAARKKVVDVVSAQLAHVLHLRKEDISPMRPLGEIGLDSLMAVELAMNLESSFHIQIPLQGSAGAMTVSDIADEVIAQIGLDSGRDDVKMDTLVKQHVTQPEALDQEALKELKEIASEDARAAKRLLS